MCGITGFWQPPGANADALSDCVRGMATTLQHRGPDDEGVWVDAAVGVAMGFRRLAIIDLSPGGHQPMTSIEQRYTIVFNGEIYNYRDLRAELAAGGHPFRSESDTEVILAGFTHWGIERTLGRMAGMFGLAVWDAEARALTLARDRLGKKPVYFGRSQGTWLFASELKALTAYPGFRADIDRGALREFLRYSYVPAPGSIYQGIHKLRPGHFVTLTLDRDAAPVCYWNAAAVAEQGLRSPLNLTDDEAIDGLDALLRDAVAKRMISDVPLGAFLSGGLDSSTIVALMQAQSTTPVKTFTIGFDVPGFNEAESARAVAAHLGTEHTELYVTPDQTRAVIPLLPAMYDEPFADSSQIPTYLVSKLARSQVTVGVSGDGGDELFAGYNRYFWAPGIWNRARWLPAPARGVLRSAIERTPPQWIDRAYGAIEPIVPSSWRMRHPGDKLQKFATVFDAPDRMEVYQRLVSSWHHPETIVVGAASAAPVSPNGAAPLDLAGGFCEQMMYRDLVTYLPDDILVKVDRASMAVSLEVRAPLLDHRVVEWAWRLSPDQRVRNGSGKWLLKQLLARYVPAALVERPKMGFAVPVDHWLRGPLRGWAEDLLSVRALEEGGLLQAAPIRRVWQQHLGGHRNHQARLWPVLTFQAWRRQWLR